MKTSLNERTALFAALILVIAACQDSPTAPRADTVWDRPTAETFVRVSHADVGPGDLVSVEIGYSRGLYESERLRARIDWDPTRFELVEVVGDDEMLAADRGAGYAHLLDGGEGRIELRFRALTEGSAQEAFRAEALVLGGEADDNEII